MTGIPFPRILMGPGPSDVHPSVLAALGRPTVGHLDPAFIALMDDVRDGLRQLFGTENELTLPMSGTGSLGMEACMVNLVSPGDPVVVGINGVFGERLAEVARRSGGKVSEVRAAYGEALDPDEVRRVVVSSGARLLAVVHAETSTGVLQDLAPLRSAADASEALFLVDCVTSLGGVPVHLDTHRVDAAYSGTQKCLSVPPGLSPVSFSARAEAVMAKRESPVQSWYLDLSLLRNYWGGSRAYHHTAPVNMIYALHEGLRLALDEGDDARFARIARMGRALVAGLQAMDLPIPVPEGLRMPQLTVVGIPDGVDEAALRQRVLQRFGLEIGGGLGSLKGRAFRIGLMGAAATERNVMLCLTAIHEALGAQGHSAPSPLDAAEAALRD